MDSSSAGWVRNKMNQQTVDGQNGVIYMLLFLIKFKKRCRGICQVELLKMPGIGHSSQRQLKRSKALMREDLLSILLTRVCRMMLDTKQVLENMLTEQRWGGIMLSLLPTPALCLVQYSWNEQSWVSDAPWSAV